MPASSWGWKITPEEFASWILDDSPELAVVNKPPFVLCHPSKHGPWSSLVGAAREFFGLPVIHMPFRLDRETSGVWLAAKTRERGVEFQRAVQERRVRKEYVAILEGEFREDRIVDQPIGRAENSTIWLKRQVRADGQQSKTHFSPIESRRGCSLVKVRPETGRLHQIRVHAAWLGHPLVGDKVYGPDESIFLDFIERGQNGKAAQLPLPRQALHCSEVQIGGLTGAMETVRFSAPLTRDLADFWNSLAD